MDQIATLIPRLVYFADCVCFSCSGGAAANVETTIPDTYVTIAIAYLTDVRLCQIDWNRAVTRIDRPSPSQTILFSVSVCACHAKRLRALDQLRSVDVKRALWWHNSYIVHTCTRDTSYIEWRTTRVWLYCYRPTFFCLNRQSIDIVLKVVDKNLQEFLSKINVNLIINMRRGRALLYRKISRCD